MAKQASKLTAFIDGASRGNPGPASVGVVMQDAKGGVLRTVSEKIGVATNNTAEYLSLIFAMQEALMMGAKEIEIFADSELLVKQCRGEYKVREESLKPLAALVRHLRRGFKKIAIAHVPREENCLADREANKALDEGFLL